VEDRRRMQRFQPGERVYVRLRFQSAVPIKNALLVFVHEEDDNEHVVFGFKTEDDLPLAPNPKSLLEFAVLITEGQKPGVYTPDKINFETFGGRTVDRAGTIEMPRFEVIPEHDIDPVVEEVSVFSHRRWLTRKDR
jgi:hypothetical protein